MAKDYFQDILPPSGEQPPRPQSTPAAVPLSAPEESVPVSTQSGERSIRNITINTGRARPFGGHSGEMPPMLPPRPKKKFSGMWLWMIAAVAILVLGGLTLFAFRKTTITVIPRSHSVTFDETSVFTAYPADTAATGTIGYTTQAFDEEDSALVPAQGTQHVETKASGSIIVVNEYSTASVKLVKNTRFQTPDGLIFRTPADIVIPGKKGSTAGTVNVTVVADAAGSQYNVGPVSRFTLPGLKGGAMYSSVYARSSTAMAGGEIGEEPATQPGAVEQAKADMRSRLEEKVRGNIKALSAASTAFFELASVTYQDLPNTSEQNGVRLHEKAHAEVPVFQSPVFASVIAQSVSADVANAPVALVPGAGFGAKGAASSTSPLSGPLSFALVGQAQLVWQVDVAQLAKDLAGHDQGAFQTVVAANPAIQEAHARIEPFWSTAFPKDPSSINVDIRLPVPQGQ